MDWLADDSLGDDWLSKGFGHNWGGVVNCGLCVHIGSGLMSDIGCGLCMYIGGRLGICNGFVSVIDNSCIIFADARVRCINMLRDMADRSMC